MINEFKETTQSNILIEVSAEVCAQIGGIYTVLSSKIPAMIDTWGDNYFLFGPYLPINYTGVFAPSYKFDDAIGQTVLKLREKKIDIHYGHWLIEGMPKVILLNPYSLQDHQADYVQQFIKNHDLPDFDEEAGIIMNFGRLVEVFLEELLKINQTSNNIIIHFHEYIAAAAIPEIKRNQLSILTVFTTHSTILGRYLNGINNHFYEDISEYNWQEESEKIGKVYKFLIHLEHLITQSTDVFTTISEIMISECIKLLGRQPDIITPNGLNINNENIDYVNYNSLIKESVSSHFSEFYNLDLDKTLFFFTSGRHEFVNKGYDLIIKALKKLNQEMVAVNIDKFVVAFFITDAANAAIKFEEDVYIKEEIRKKPGILTKCKPKIDEEKDDIILNLLSEGLDNEKADRVKVLYHPEFISTDSLFISATYKQFIQGCDLGIFPSKYEPWGYTPHECIINGTPAITSSLSGFGQYILKNLPSYEEHWIKVLNRSDSISESVDELTKYLFDFVKTSEPSNNKIRSTPDELLHKSDWRNLIHFYNEAYVLALQNLKVKN